MIPFSAAILAGGQSRRMGRDKASLQLGGRSLIEHVLAAVRPLDCPTFIVARQAIDHTHLGLPVCPDLFPGAGPLGGLCTALHHTSTPVLLLLACDLPFLTPEFLRFLAESLGERQAAVPQSPEAEGLHPLCAAYATSCLPAVERLLDQGEGRMYTLCRQLDLRVLTPEEWQPFDPHGLLLSNLNTPEEYQRAQESLSGRA
ncbi:MAG: molybdenum cofactor guanylyltransferase [Candidatus Latescibacteria bacterium]|nr:molybdenum cofactor guanylyltransferase [Candidatus Latescibacterota bacterium]